MSDLGRDIGGAPDEDRLPWLEPVEEERGDEGVSAGRLIAGLIVALIALGLVVGGVYWLKQRASGQSSAAPGDSRLIAAAPGPYKVKPAEPGGMKVKGQGDSTYAASEGADPNAPIDLSATPEQPVTRGKPAAAQPAPAKAANQTPAATKPQAPAMPAAPARTETAKAAPAPTGAGATIQLGALDSEAKANAAWKALSGRYQYLAPLNHSVVKAEVNGKTYYRLRASGPGAGGVCAKLKVAGESCIVVG